MSADSDDADFLEEADRGADPRHPIRRRLAQLRGYLHSRAPWTILIYRVLVALLGSAIVAVGVVLIPLPGPGWLIVFLGLAVLGTEFRFARRLTRWLRVQLGRFWDWWRERRARRAAA